MLRMVVCNTRQLVSGLAAVAVVAFVGFTFDQAHVSAAPYGAVEVGELTPVNLEKLAQVTLPEVVITAARTA